MNETINTILKRRSIRSYKAEQIPQADLEAILRAGLYAPSGRNTQAWHVCVLRSRRSIDELTREVKAGIARLPANRYTALVSDPAYSVNFNAPTFIIVSVDSAVSLTPEADCALLLGNLFLAACSLGIGSCWVNQLNALNDETRFRIYTEKLGLPPGNRIYGCGAFGYAETTPAAPPRREGAVNFVE